MSRQTVMDKRGRTLGYIDTDPDGLQRASSLVGYPLGRFDPRTNQTFDPSGEHVLAEGNTLSGMVRNHRAAQRSRTAPMIRPSSA